jgi:hypothetical protein
MGSNSLQPKPAIQNSTATGRTMTAPTGRQAITVTGRTMTAPTGKQAYKGNTRTTSKLPQLSSLKPKQAFQKGKLPQSP